MTTLARRLGLGDAVAIGLGSMIGAGVFVVWGPAARAAGSWLVVSLAVAAVVAVCNAWSSAALAARYPSAGGTYVYGRERLGQFVGYLAGWSFIVGKIASCAAMAMAIAAYAAPGRERVAAVVAVLVVTVLNLTGVQRSARVSRVIVSIVLAVLVGVVVAGLAAGQGKGAPPELWSDAPSPYGILQGAGLIFFAFAGYARIATLAEEVEAPERTIPRAVAITVGIVLGVYAVVAVLTLVTLGPEHLASVGDPVAAAADEVLSSPWVWALRAAAVLAAFGALLNLVLGVSRTTLAMARDGHLPSQLARVNARRVPQGAEIAVGLIVIVLVLVVDLRGAIGFSSFGVLTYYAIANASAWTLRGDWRWAGTVPVLGLAGCLMLAWTLPWESVLGGAAVIAVGALAYLVRNLVADAGSAAGR